MRERFSARASSRRGSGPLGLLAGAAAAIALLAAGCRDQSPEERYAESVCSTILPRAQEILDTSDDVIHTRAAPGPDARIMLWALALRGTEITRKLQGELHALSVPDTPEGRKAAQYVNFVARVAFDRVMAEEQRARTLPESITLVQSIRGLDRLQLALSSAFSELKGYDIVKVEVPELKRSFETADSCKKLDGLATD